MMILRLLPLCLALSASPAAEREIAITWSRAADVPPVDGHRVYRYSPALGMRMLIGSARGAENDSARIEADAGDVIYITAVRDGLESVPSDPVTIRPEDVRIHFQVAAPVEQFPPAEGAMAFETEILAADLKTVIARSYTMVPAGTAFARVRVRPVKIFVKKD